MALIPLIKLKFEESSFCSFPNISLKLLLKLKQSINLINLLFWFILRYLNRKFNGFNNIIINIIIIGINQYLLFSFCAFRSYISNFSSSIFSNKITISFNSKNNFLRAFSEHPFFIHKPNNLIRYNNL